MRYYEYSPSQLEEKANQLIVETNAERLSAVKEIDVYDIVEHIGCLPDWKYITPVKKVMGLTAFYEGTMYFWPESQYQTGMIPECMYVDKGTIIIDQSILDDKNLGKERFTVMHECFHWLLHKKCFNRRQDGFSSMCGNTAFRSFSEKKKGMTALEINEYQANFCAAAFLMPKQVVRNVFQELYGNTIKDDEYLPVSNEINNIIVEASKVFQVNYSAMKYRLQSLQVIARSKSNEAEYIIK